MKPIRFADFPLAEYEQRITRADRVMEECGLDALIVTEPANLRYLFGFQNMMQLSANRSFVGLLPREMVDEATMFIPHDCQDAPQSWVQRVSFWDQGHEPPFDDRFVDLTQVARRLDTLNLGSARIGLELGPGTRVGLDVDQFDELRKALAAATIVDGSNALWALRKIKSEAEVDLIRTIGEISHAAIAEVLDTLQAGMTEKQVYRLIYARMFERGADGQGMLGVQFGLDGWTRANMAPTDNRPLAPGDWVYIDGGGILNGYCADICRMKLFGSVDKERLRFYEKVSEVTGQIIGALRPGMLCSEVYGLGRELLEQRGLAGMIDGMSFGHGIGLNLHEMPDLNRDNHEPLEEGMVLAIEPWVLDREVHGLFNHEENVVVRPGGAEVLTCG